MRFSPAWILIFVTSFVSSHRLRAEPAISEERNGVKRLVEVLHALPRDVKKFKRDISKAQKILKEEADAIHDQLWFDFKKHIGQLNMESLDRMQPKTRQDAAARGFYEYIHKDPGRITKYTQWTELLDDYLRNSAALAPILKPVQVHAATEITSHDMAKLILPTFWDEFKRSSAPLSESYNVQNFFHLSLKLQNEIKLSFWKFIYADQKRADMFEALIHWLNRSTHRKVLLAQDIEAQKQAEVIKQQLWNEFRQEDDLSGYDDVPTFDRLDENSKLHIGPFYMKFINDDPRRKELSEQLARLSK